MSKLEMKRLLRGGTLADLTATYDIKAKADAGLGVVMLNHNQIASPMAETICQERSDPKVGRVFVKIHRRPVLSVRNVTDSNDVRGIEKEEE